MSVSSDLFQALISRQWTAALRILRNETKKSNGSNIINMQSRTFPTALHLACFRRDTPLEAVKLLLNSSADAALVKNENGNTPLHFSIAMSSEEIILMLIEACPKAAVIQNNKGETPLYYAISRYRSMSIIRSLLDADPTNVDDNLNNSPLFLYCALWHSGIRSMKAHFDSLSSPSILQLYIQNYEGEVKKVKELYDITCLLLKAAVHKSLEDKNSKDTPWLPLHASIKIQSFPWTLFYLLLKANPFEARSFDEKGNLPIHLIAESPTHGHHVEKTRVILGELSLNACIPNKKGRLPLHLAAENGKEYVTGGVEEIFYAAPDALGTRDVTTHMLPFMAASEGGTNSKNDMHLENEVSIPSRQESLDRFTLAYALLMEDPTLVSWGIPKRGMKRASPLKLGKEDVKMLCQTPEKMIGVNLFE